MGDPCRVCEVCQRPPADAEWIILNRYAIGTGRARGCFSVLGPDDEYTWEPDEDATTGVLLHRDCLPLFIDMKMAEIDAMVD